jgi:Bacterial Ig-like domain
VTVGTLAAGGHAITAKATDLAGNVGTASAALSVTIDATAPAAPSVTNDSTTVISRASEANATITLSDGVTQIGTGSTNGAEAWSIPIVLTTGTHALIAQATDPAGNVSSPSAALSVRS